MPNTATQDTASETNATQDPATQASATQASATQASATQASAALEDLTGNYNLDPAHTRLGFSARHAMVTTVRGQFSDFVGAAHIDTADPAQSTVELTIQVASVDTGVADRDAHLKSADFFDADQWPTITFKSTGVARVGTVWSVTGDLTIKDQTKPITIEFSETGSAKDPFGNVRAGFEGQTQISRKEWGLTWNVALEAGGLLVSDQIRLDFDISAIAV